MAEHKCFIQPVYDKTNEEQNAEDQDEDNSKPKPLLVYADFECYLNEDNQFVLDMICYSTSESEEIHTLKGWRVEWKAKEGNACLQTPGF